MARLRREEFRELSQDLEAAKPGARERAEVLSRASNAFSAAAACAVLADYESRRGRFTEALRSANMGGTRLVSARAKGPEADWLRASLLVQRGVAYAGLGRMEDAIATHDELARDYPKYETLEASKFKICLLAATRLGELEDALEMVQMRNASKTPTPVDRFEQIVCDALEVALGGGPNDANSGTGPNGMEEKRARVRAVIADDRLLADWLRFSAPGLIEKLATPSEAPPAAIRGAEQSA
jgi:tetratricopeptide (TPR) repeat protein